MELQSSAMDFGFVGRADLDLAPKFLPRSRAELCSWRIGGARLTVKDSPDPHYRIHPSSNLPEIMYSLRTQRSSKKRDASASGSCQSRWIVATRRIPQSNL